ncbi:MAG TPA: DUF881 domain-containing protein [Symbiobacteriaceae bacterium]|jgi:uncharacterized protein YlxW (UPF0749 family)|nr:DUF881 domain-containing protein [Symbiobacteriaceae bacterium]
MKTFRHMPWAIALVFVVLGFMLSMQFKVTKAAQLKDTTSFMRAQELAQELDKVEEERDKLSVELEDMRTQMTKVVNNQTEYKDLAQQLEQAQLHAGLVPLAGQGVVVEMRDSTRSVTAGENANNFILHDVDILQVVNELFATGAEAIAINDQRVTGRTEIRCVGPVVTINGVRTAPPVIIKAIGNADDLERVVNMKDGLKESLMQWGVQISVRKEQSLTVPAFKGSLKLQYASPVTQEVGKP